MRCKMTQPITLLLISIGLLLAGHGMQLSLLPLHASSLGWSDLEIGLTGAAYFLGFIIGCLVIPRWLSKVGHIRVFVCLTALAAISLLLLESIANQQVWMVLRFLTGCCLAGIYTTAESWLNEQSDNQGRGTLISIYVVVVLVGMAFGQILLGVFPQEYLFRIAAGLMISGILPIGLFCADQPIPLIAPRNIQFWMVKQLSLLPAAGLVLAGIVTGSIWTLAPLIGEAKGLPLASIGMMMNAIILGGAVIQIPAGRASDVVGRRHLILLLACFCAFSATGLMFIPAGDNFWLMAGMFFLGGSSLTLYAICAADIQDTTSLGRIEASALILLLSSAGSVLGPVIVGLVSALTLHAFFIATTAAMIILVAIAGLSKPLRLAEVIDLPVSAENDKAPAPVPVLRRVA
ncbi:MAG: MFS family permease [Candidatus Azotimanducaceae bacterium]